MSIWPRCSRSVSGVWAAAVNWRGGCRFRTEKAIGAADGIKGTFAYLIGDSFAKLGLGMIADGTPFWSDRLGGHLRRAGRRRDRLYLPDGDGRRDGRAQDPP